MSAIDELKKTLDENKNFESSTTISLRLSLLRKVIKEYDALNKYILHLETGMQMISDASSEVTGDELIRHVSMEITRREKEIQELKEWGDRASDFAG